MKTLEQLLVEDAAEPLPDDGFRFRVMEALPARAPRRVALWRPALILGSTLLGSVLAAVLAPAGASALQGVMDLASFHYLTPGALAVMGCALTLAIGGAVIAADD